MWHSHSFEKVSIIFRSFEHLAIFEILDISFVILQLFLVSDILLRLLYISLYNHQMTHCVTIIIHTTNSITNHQDDAPSLESINILDIMWATYSLYPSVTFSASSAIIYSLEHSDGDSISINQYIQSYLLHRSILSCPIDIAMTSMRAMSAISSTRQHFAMNHVSRPRLIPEKLKALSLSINLSGKES